MQAKAKALGMTVTYQGSPDFAPSAQTPIVDGVCSKHPSVLVVSPTDPVAMAPAINTCLNEGIPVITVDTQLSNTSRLTAEITTDNNSGGKAAGDYVGKALDSTGQVALISLSPTATTQVDRLQALDSVLKSSYPESRWPPCSTPSRRPPRVRPLCAPSCPRTRRSRRSSGLPSRTPRVRSPRSPPLGLAGKVLVVGWDASPAEVALLKKGTLAATVAQQAAQEGAMAAQYAYDKLTKKTSAITVPPEPARRADHQPPGRQAARLRQVLLHSVIISLGLGLISARGRPRQHAMVPARRGRLAESLVRVPARSWCGCWAWGSADPTWSCCPASGGRLSPGCPATRRSVSAAGPGVAAAPDRRAGVVIEPNFPCLRCPACRSGLTSRCPDRIAAGFTSPGLLAERVAVPAPYAWPVPGGWADTDAVCAEPLTRGPGRAAPQRRRAGQPVPGRRGRVAGRPADPGPHRRGGIEPYVLEPHQGRRRLAAELGAREAHPGEGGFTTVFETSGAQTALAEATTRAARGATVMLIGLDGHDIEIDTALVVRRQLVLRGSMIYDHPGDFAATLASAIPSPGRVLRACYPLADAEAALRAAAEAPGKTWIRVSGEEA